MSKLKAGKCVLRFPVFCPEPKFRIVFFRTICYNKYDKRNAPADCAEQLTKNVIRLLGKEPQPDTEPYKNTIVPEERRKRSVPHTALKKCLRSVWEETKAYHRIPAETAQGAGFRRNTVHNNAAVRPDRQRNMAMPLRCAVAARQILSGMRHTCPGKRSGGIKMNHKKLICTLLLSLTITAGTAACGKNGSDVTESTAENVPESSIGATDEDTPKHGKVTPDGRLVSDEELLTVPDEVTLKGTKTKVGWTQTDGVMRIRAMTGEIGGKTYTILESGTLPASYIQVRVEHENAYMFGVSEHAVVAELFEDGSAEYLINVSSDQCILLKIIPDGIDEKEAKKMFKKEFEATAELYDTLIVDFINESEIKWS